MTTLALLLRTLDPLLRPGVFVYATAPSGQLPDAADLIGWFREDEGLTLIVAEPVAVRLGLSIHFRAAWISLRVESELSAVGLTAAMSTALAAQGISCNVIAALHHDHLLVPIDQAEAALACLRTLQRQAQSST